jgi:hypothetical protein
MVFLLVSWAGRCLGKVLVDDEVWKSVPDADSGRVLQLM